MTDFPPLAFKWQWLPAPDVKAPELSSTWASLQIYVGSQCITLVEDAESSSSRRSIFVPLYPMAEWIAFNWWSLVADSRPATVLSRLGDRGDVLLGPTELRSRQRHGVRAAGDGFLWPDLLILPEGRTTRICWRPDHTHAEPIRYLTRGEAVLDSAEVQRRLSHLVEAVIARLQESGIAESSLESEWQAISGMDDEETAYCIAAARLGLDPYSEAEPYEESILAAARTLQERDLLGDFLDAVEPAEVASTLGWVEQTLAEISDLPGGAATIAPLRSRVTSLAGDEVSGLQPRYPWDVGWRQARIVRNALEINDQVDLRIEEIVPSVKNTGPTRSLYALGKFIDGADPMVAVARDQRQPAHRFTLARALWHLLWTSSSTFLVTNAYTERQRIERAFAAELLAPASGITSQIGKGSIYMLDDDAIVELAANYGVSEMVIRHQIENQLVR